VVFTDYELVVRVKARRERKTGSLVLGNVFIFLTYYKIFSFSTYYKIEREKSRES